jgi:peptidoglycan/LPS O-acetylase OafA/YrhL
VPDLLLQSSCVLILLACFLGVGEILARWWPFYREQVETAPGARYESLEGLRGILALSVFLHHACATHHFLRTGDWGTDIAPLRLMGGIPVTFFFMMTGFLYWTKAIKGNRRIKALELYRGRALRIVPLYLVSATIVLAIVLTLTGLPAGKDRAASWGGIVRLMGGAGSLPLHPINGMDPGDINASVLWTLHFEWAFYLLIPFVARMARPAGLLALCLVCAAILFVHDVFLHTRAGTTAIMCMTIFILGMAAAQIIASFGAPRWAKSPWAALLGLALLLAAFWFEDPYNWVVRFLLLAAFMLFVSGGDLGGVLTTRGARALGAMGLSIYLLHGIVLFLARPLLQPLADTPSPGVRYWLVIGGIGMVVIAVSAVSYRWIEYPVIAWDQRSRKARRRVAKPAESVRETTSVAG